MEEKVRLSDIASELGLSTAAVSYVLHGKTGMVSERTAVRVRRALEERGYLPRAAEVLLAENPAKIVGVVINVHEKQESHVLEDAFIASTLNALSVETARRGLQMMVRAVNALDEIVSFATMWNLEGLVLIGFCSADYGRLRENVRVPFAVYDACGVTAERVCAVNIDDHRGGFQVGEYLRLCGLVYPSLTSVRQDNAERARTALGAIAKMRAGAPVEPVITLPTTLVVRDSTRSPL